MILKSFYSISFICLLICSSCDKEDGTPGSCIDAYLEQNGMVKYKDQEIGCKSFLNLYEFENKEYFLLGNHCADMISFPTDCEGKRLCEDPEETESCNNFYQNAKFKGIIGVRE